ncbi:hypothetical protein [Engelhardtia mirabilis]|uniref:SMP-30/Gluconolaconase/LRE-like region n=1 Tax=Engelhardtia mirabilis TaxID=2528011 RepID=A0A518BKN8_9BACT|nr:hypothetical protein Pla133_26280 [Planctomycetes bacterium Pla133]QDV01866.1 hypothetical protein Pla86_26270 [Planctomycetes bacterium Pla86]
MFLTSLRPLTAHLAPIALALGACLAPTALAQETVANGFGSQLSVDPSGSVRELSSGDLLTYDGRFVDRWAADGTFQLNIADLGSSFFSGAFAIAPDESFAVVGETTNGDMFRVALDGSGVALIANVVFNYDAKFAPSGELYVSAAQGGFGTGNDVIRLDPFSGAKVDILHVAGPSGPIAFDSSGNLFYATYSNLAQNPAVYTDVLLYPAASIAAPATPMSEADGIVYASGFDGASSMVADRTQDLIYLAEASFSAGTNRLRLVAGSAAASPVLVEGQLGDWITVAQFIPGTGAAQFAPYQPSAGGRLIYGRTDFFSFDERRTLSPARPTLTVTGAGTSGPGSFSLDFAGLDPAGSMLLLWGPTALTGPEFAVGTLPPLFTGLDLGSIQFLPFQLGVQPDGSSHSTFFNPGGLQGLLTFQGLLLDSFGAPEGATTMGSL